jgi:hypothetical protein
LSCFTSEVASPRTSVRGFFSTRLDRRSAPRLHHGNIVPVNASVFNKSRLFVTMIVIAATEQVRREASLRGRQPCRGQQRSTKQRATSRHLHLAPSGLADVPMSLNQRGKS